MDGQSINADSSDLVFSKKGKGEREPLLKNPEDIARQAFEDGNAEVSVKIHQLKKGHKQSEKHKGGGPYIKSAVFGGVDGIVTTFSTIASLAGAYMDARGILILGIANLIADGVAMGVGDYISEKSEYNFALSEQRRERWECDNYLEGEIQEMVEIYVSKGMDEADAKRAVELLSKNKDHFTDVMMAEELGMMPPDPDESQFYMGLATFVSFLIFGTIPLLPYIISISARLHEPSKKLFNYNFIASIPATLLTLFALGAISSKFTSGKWVKSGLWLVLTGGIASAFSFVCAYGLGKIVDVPPGII